MKRTIPTWNSELFKEKISLLFDGSIRFDVFFDTAYECVAYSKEAGYLYFNKKEIEYLKEADFGKEYFENFYQHNFDSANVYLRKGIKLDGQLELVNADKTCAIVSLFIGDMEEPIKVIASSKSIESFSEKIKEEYNELALKLLIEVI